MITTFDEYEEAALATVAYPRMGNNIIYPALKLNGEAGEVAEKVGKLWRNFNKEFPADYTDAEKEAILLELGDVLWYITACANELGADLVTVADMNIKKLKDRRKRGVIKSEGDNR